MLLGAVAAAIGCVSSASAWRSPLNYEGSAAHIISAKDTQPSREPDIALDPDGSLVGAWSYQFSMVLSAPNRRKPRVRDVEDIHHPRHDVSDGH